MPAPPLMSGTSPRSRYAPFHWQAHAASATSMSKGCGCSISTRCAVPVSMPQRLADPAFAQHAGMEVGGVAQVLVKPYRYAPPVRMIRLSEQREITPYVWVRPDEDRWLSLERRDPSTISVKATHIRCIRRRRSTPMSPITHLPAQPSPTMMRTTLSPTRVCSMLMPRVQTGARSHGSCCTLIPIKSRLGRGGPSTATSLVPNG